METSIWSRRSDGNSSHHPTPLRRTAIPRNVSPESVNLNEEDETEDVVSLPPQPTPERPDDNTYDYTTASPTAPNAQYRPEADSERRGSTSSSASGSTSEIPQIQVTPAPAPMVRARRVLIRSASSDRAEDSIGTTPGMGRRLPSAEKGKDASVSYIIDPKLVEGNTDNADDMTPSRSSHGTPLSSGAVTAPSTALTSRGYSYSATPEALATPRPASNDADLERRKMHLLSTLRMTALKSNKRVRLARGTPHPRDRRARSVTPSAMHDEDSTNEMDASAAHGALAEDMTAMSGSSTLSTGSSNDLTTNPRGHGNTSLPLAGAGAAADGGIVGTSRFNNAKLNNYLHTLNTHLTTENQNLVRTLEETAKEVSRLMRKNEELSRINATDDLSAGASARSMSRIAEEDGDDANATREILQSHRKTSQDISALHERLTGSTSSKPSTTMQEELREKNSRLEKLEADLKQRDEEIAALRKDILRQGNTANGDDSNVEDAPTLLQQQIFDLRDELSEVKALNTIQGNDLAKARAEQLEQSSRHNKVMAELQGRVDDLVSEIEEKEAIIEEIEVELVKQEEDFRAKMSNLEEELCKVMEEQEGQLREARKELQSIKKAQDGSSIETGSELELRNRLAVLEEEKKELLEGKVKAEAMLHEATATIARNATSSQPERADNVSSEEVTFLQKRIEELEAEVAQKTQQLLEVREKLEQAKHEHEAEVNDLRNGIDAADNNQAQLERKLASQATLLKQTEKAFTESEDNLKQTVEDLEDARKQLQNVHDEVKELKNEQIELLNSDLQKKYDAAVREIGNLKHQLAYPAPSSQNAQGDKYSKHDSRDIEIKTLRSSNHELESRVNQLRKQAMLSGQSPSNRSSSSMATPGRAEKSVRFDSVRSMRTPRTASQLLGGVSDFQRDVTWAA